MLIRCEKCSTTYELEERLIPPGGAPVQCSRCEHVFRAYPPSRAGAPAAEAERRPGLELVPPPPDDLPDDAPSPAPAAVEPHAAEPFPREAAPEPEAPPPEATPSDSTPLPPAAPPYAAVTKTPAPASAAESVSSSAPTPAVVAPEERSSTTAVPAPLSGTSTTYKPPPGPVIPPGKPVRKVPNPELEGSDVSSVAPMPRRAVSFDVGGTTKRPGKSSWIVTGAVGVLALLVVAGTISWWQERRAEKAAQQATAAAAPAAEMRRERQDALRLLMRDDAGSVERAAAQLDDMVRREPASAARADRALALALLSQQATDDAARLESRARALEEERAQAEAGGADAGAQATALAAEAETVRAEVSPLQERAGRLLSEARAELEAVPAKLSGDAAAVRARAWVQLVSGSPGDAAKTAGAAPAGGEDPWLALAAILAGLPENGDGAAHERVAQQLEQLAGKHPGFVRPLLLAGRIRAGLGDGAGALADFDRVLAANPQHVEARRVRAELALVVPEAPAAAVPGGDAASPGPSPAVDRPSQRGNAPAVPPGR